MPVSRKRKVKKSLRWVSTDRSNGYLASSFRHLRKDGTTAFCGATVAVPGWKPNNSKTTCVGCLKSARAQGLI